MPFPGNRGRGGGGGTGGPDRFTTSDEAHLDALPPLWAAGVHAVDDQVSWDGKVYRCLVARTATDTDNPATDTTGWAEVGTGSSTGGLTQVASDATLTGDGRSSHPLTVANPFTDDDEAHLDGIEAGATADQTAAEIIGAIEGETGNARLDAQALRNYPDASTTGKGYVELATRAEAAARTDTERAVTPDALPLATAAQPGLIEIAAQAEADAGTDGSKAMTPALTTRQLGQQVTADEIAAGTETSIRRFSPANIVALVLAHEAEGLTQTEVDARVRALVLAVALQGNTDRWPKNKLPADLVDTAALTAAVMDFVPSGTITTERAAAITAAINALDAVTDGGAWAAGTAYAVRVIVRHAGATYLSIRAVAANTAATTEPGVGSDWETSWDRLGYEDGPPNAIVGVTLAERTLTFARESGENPLEIGLPVGTGSAYRWYSHYDATTTPALSFTPITTNTPIAIDSQHTQVLLDAMAPAITPGDPITTDYEGAIHVLHSTQGRRNIEIAIGYTLFEGVPEKQFTSWRTAHLEGSNGQDLLVPADVFSNHGILDIGTIVPLDGGGTYTWTAADFENPIPVRITLRVRGFTPGDATVRREVTIGSLTWELAQIVAYQLGAATGPAGPAGPSTFTPTDLGTTTFDLTGSAAQVALTDDANDPIVCPATGYILAIVNAPSLGLVGSLSWMLAADLRDAAADSALVAGLYTNTDNEIVFHAGMQDGGASTGNEIIIQHIGTSTDDSGGAAPVIQPSILRFDITGDASPAPGSIAGDSYGFALAISQVAEVGAARIVGFAGAPARNPSSVAVLHTVPSGSYHADSGTVTIPAGVSLAAAGDHYTIRLEVYPTGTAPSAAPPIYHDYVITARAPAAEVHFGVVQYVAADTTTAQRAARIVFADDDIATAGSAAGDWLFSGVPADGNEYIPYWAVPTSLAQPTHWVTSSIDITNFLEPAERRTIGGVDYDIYLYHADSRADDSVNGSTVTTRTT
ncbi:MAG: hypothetical protein F4Y02_11220 [Chloroflexi bacterium]|nr:hypothetical protein [Chloroflexota bacterium]